MPKSKVNFKELDHVNNAFYEVELVQAQMEHKEPIFVAFFILQYAKLWPRRNDTTTFSPNFVT